MALAPTDEERLPAGCVLRRWPDGTSTVERPSDPLKRRLALIGLVAMLPVMLAFLVVVVIDGDLVGIVVTTMLVVVMTPLIARGVDAARTHRDLVLLPDGLRLRWTGPDGVSSSTAVRLLTSREDSEDPSEWYLVCELDVFSSHRESLWPGERHEIDGLGRRLAHETGVPYAPDPPVDEAGPNA